jgi:Branched-chain amino acid aminotransferase/4-amino-4-deoxychorismate lyase
MNSIDKRNEAILVHINGELVPRNEAKISVFDSAVQGGDAVWEGLRIYKGRIAALAEHLQRLQDSAKALMFENIPSSTNIKAALFPP